MNIRTAKLAVIALAVLLTLYAATGFLLLPWLAQRYLPSAIEERLGRDVNVGEFLVNPFLLTFEANRVSVEGHHGQPMLSVGRLFADASLPGLLRGTWTLDELLLEGVQAHAVVQADGTVNFVDAVKRWQRPATTDSAPPAVLIKQLVIPDARVEITAFPGAGAAQATLHPVQLRAKSISTVASHQPLTFNFVAALPQGGSFASTGDVTLEPAPAASGRFVLRQLHAEMLLPFLRETLLLSELQGTVDFSGGFLHQAEQPLSLQDIHFGATGVRVTRQGGPDPLLVAQRVVAQDGSLDLGRHAVRIGELLLEDGQVRVAISPDEGVNWAGVVAANPAGAERQPEPPSSWTLDVPRLRLDQIGLAYTDSGSQPLALEADGLSADLQLSLATGGDQTRLVADEIQARWNGAALRMPGSTVPEVTFGPTALEQGSFDLSRREIFAQALRLQDGRVSAVATTQPSQQGGTDPAAEPWKVRIANLQVAGLGGRYARRAQADTSELAVARIDGRLELAMTLGGPQPQVVASGIDAKVQDAVLSGARKGQTSVRLATAQVAEGRFDLAARQVGAAKVVVAGSADLVRSRGGQFVFSAPWTDSEPAAKSRAGEAGPQWRYAIDAIEVPSLALELVDRSFEPALQMGAKVRARASPVVSGKPASFDANVTFSQGGNLTASGTAIADPAQVRAQVKAQGIPLRPFQPLLEPVAAMQIVSGAASGSGELQYDSGHASLSLQGRLGIANLRLNEAASGERFLAWNQLEALGASLDLSANRRQLTVREITVQRPEAKIVISENRDVNLMQVFKRDDDPTGAPDGERESRPGFVFEIDQVRLQGGEVDFSDESLVLPFSTTVTGLDGTIVGISSDPARRAAVKATGAIEPYGSASLEGSLVPVAPTQFTSLDVQFNNVPVPPLSPYTATFAGRKVESGRLWLGLEYRIERGELLGRNDIRLQDFKLGERVQAPNALDVPLDLVVALLSDSTGAIRLSVPVTGELGSARFSVGSAVRQAIGNVLQRAVSAPFRALANLFGGDSESLGAIHFKPGSAQLRPQELEKLDALTRALRERPRLDLVVEAPHDPELDAAAMRQEQARRALTQALGRNVGPQEEPGPISFDDPVTRRAIESTLQSVAGEQAVQEVAQEFGDRPGKYEAMLDRIAAAQALSDNATQLLAVERAQEIANYLQRQGIDRSRVKTGRIASDRAQNNEVSSQLQVAAASG